MYKIGMASAIMDGSSGIAKRGRMVKESAAAAAAPWIVSTGIPWLGNMVKNIGSGSWDLIKSIPHAALGTILAGAGVGTMAALAQDAVSENLSKVDPKEKLNARLEKEYKLRMMELEDRDWMSKVRSLSDELKRGYKKMDPSEYSKKYNELLYLLDERSDS